MTGRPPDEIRPLLRQMEDMAKRLAGRDCDDIVEALVFYRQRVTNDFTAKVVCREILRLCRPRAWGDRFVTGIHHADWLLLLQNLQLTGERALERIEERQTAD